jgi:hypothetical protein
MFRRLATAAACALVLLLSSAATAHADARTLIDGAGDVWWHTDENTRAPEHRRGDILRVTVGHTAQRVAIRTKFARLDRKGPRLVIASRLRTNSGLIRWVRLFAGPGRSTWAGNTQLYRRDNTTPVSCAVTHQVDYSDDVAVIRIPRSCLDDPRWVQAALGVATLNRSGYFADNPFNHGPTVFLPDYTRRIRRG